MRKQLIVSTIELASFTIARFWRVALCVVLINYWSDLMDSEELFGEFIQISHYEFNLDLLERLHDMQSFLAVPN